MRSFMISFVSVVCGFLTLFGNVGDAVPLNGSFVVVGPKILKRGDKETICVSLFGIKGNGTVTLSLTAKNSTTSLFQVLESQPSKCYNIPIPSGSEKERSADLVFEAKFGDFSVVHNKTVRLRKKPVITLIQTDKPWYLPGQIVKFRIVRLDSSLRPYSKKIQYVWVEDPNGVVVQQWSNTTNDYGLAQFELPLCTEPVEGTWKIWTKRLKTPKLFQVKEYVLPRFEVSLMSNTSARDVRITVCATYSYGEPVLMRYSLRCQTDRRWTTFSLEKHGEGLGCATTVISKRELERIEDRHSDTLMQVLVKVTEDGTDSVVNATTKVVLKATGTRIEFTKKSDTFHIGIPYFGEGFVSRAGEAQRSETIDVCLTSSDEDQSANMCDKVVTDDNGKFRFSFLPQDDAVDEYEITASSEKKLKTERAAKAKYEIKRVLSLSNSAIVLKQDERKYKCGEEVNMKFYVAGVGSTLEIQYYVIARGSVLEGRREKVKIVEEKISTFKDILNEQGTDGIKVKMFSLTRTVSQSMAPEFQILVFFVQSNSEVVTTSGKFSVEPCFPNKVQMHWTANAKNNPKIFPGRVVTLNVTANEGSVCGVVVVDKSVTFLDPQHQLKAEDPFKEISKLTISPSEEPLQKTADHLFCTKERTKDFQDFDDYDDEEGCSSCESVQEDSITSFDDTGLFVMSDIQMEHRRCKLDLSISPRWLDYQGISTKRGSSSNDELTSGLELRNYFPETWLWETFNSPANLSYTTPHTITDWVGKAICLHRDGFGMSQDVTLRVMQPFFIDFSLPYSVKKEETLSLKVSVFNYAEENLQVQITLRTPQGIIVLDGTERLCSVSPQRKYTHTFRIKPTEIGDMFIEVEAVRLCSSSDQTSEKSKGACKAVKDRVRKQLLVIPDGIMVEETETAFICQNDMKKSISWKPTLPRNYIQGSERGWLTGTGDIMGAALTDLDDLVSLPTGCGEQNMVKFAPIAYVLKYMNATDQEDEDLKRNAFRFLQIGYQRQQKYRHDDGSYSAFGKYDERGSLWLTAFVVRSFSAAREFITIDRKDLGRSISWILGSQNSNTGCFRPIGKLISGGLNGGVGEGNTVALTAYVLASLVEASSVKKVPSSSLSKAEKCILKSSSRTPYEQSLITYALVKYATQKQADDERKREQNWKEARLNIEELLRVSKTDSQGLTWWEDDSQSKALSIEMTAYNIMSLTIYKENHRNTDVSRMVRTALNAVRWLTKQRNAKGGFVSTQDTVVGLQSLSSYAEDFSSRFVDIAAKFSLTSLKGSGGSGTFFLTQDNKMILQKHKFDSIPKELALDIDAKSGCGIFQMVLRFNIPRHTEKPKFNVSTVICDSGKRKTLVGYVQYEQGQKSNMAIVDVEIPSGYIADKASLIKLQDDSTTAVKRTEYEKGHVNLYFDELKDDREKFTFGLIQEHHVENIKPALTVAYDYYAPEKQGSVVWSIAEHGGEECNELDGFSY